MNTDSGGAIQDRIVARIAKGRGEEIRVALSRFKGRDYLAFRVWFQDVTGEMRPSSRGLNVRVELLPEILDGIGRAYEEARSEGLV